MKKFLTRLSVISTLLVTLTIFLFIARWQVIIHHSWKLPQGVHILFLGASHINHAIDDSLIPGTVNWTKGSERYMYTYIKLQHLLPENPQIDTIFLELAPTDLWEDTDYKYHVLNEQSGYVKLYWPFFSWEQWKIFKSEPRQVLGLVLESLGQVSTMNRTKWWKEMGGYKNVTGELDTTSVQPTTMERNGSGHAINYDYLRRIISLCNERKIKLYFLETPTYHPEYFYDQAYFYRSYKEYFCDVEFLDYSKRETESTEMYDAHHLNHKGAVRFTKELVKSMNDNKKELRYESKN